MITPEEIKAMKKQAQAALKVARHNRQLYDFAHNTLRLLDEIERLQAEWKQQHSANNGLCAEVERLESLLKKAAEMATKIHNRIGFYAPNLELGFSVETSQDCCSFLSDLAKFRGGE